MAREELHIKIPRAQKEEWEARLREAFPQPGYGHLLVILEYVSATLLARGVDPLWLADFLGAQHSKYARPEDVEHGACADCGAPLMRGVERAAAELRKGETPECGAVQPGPALEPHRSRCTRPQGHEGEHEGISGAWGGE